jgi:hypothetical protein
MRRDDPIDFFELSRVGGGVRVHHFVAKFECTPDRSFFRRGCVRPPKTSEKMGVSSPMVHGALQKWRQVMENPTTDVTVF